MSHEHAEDCTCTVASGSFNKGLYEERERIRGILRDNISKMNERLHHAYDNKPRDWHGEPDWSASTSGLHSFIRAYEILLDQIDGRDTLLPYLE